MGILYVWEKYVSFVLLVLGGEGNVLLFVRLGGCVFGSWFCGWVVGGGGRIVDVL